MNKIIFLSITILCFSLIISCSNNDETPSLLGQWEYLKQGTVTNGQEDLTDYIPQTGCQKNYSIITSSVIMDHVYNGINCAESISNQSYTREGDILTVEGESVVYTFKIKTLNSTTLKLYLTFVNSEPSTLVFVFKRIS